MITPGKDGKIRKSDAITALVGSVISGASDGSETVYHEGQTPPTEEAIEAKHKELQAEYDAKKYQRDRQYPPIGDQLDKIYHEGIDAWKVDIKAVKDTHPKPT